jgi:hypothetical protein
MGSNRFWPVVSSIFTPFNGCQASSALRHRPDFQFAEDQARAGASALIQTLLGPHLDLLDEVRLVTPNLRRRPACQPAEPFGSWLRDLHPTVAFTENFPYQRMGTAGGHPWTTCFPCANGSFRSLEARSPLAGASVSAVWLAGYQEANLGSIYLLNSFQRHCLPRLVARISSHCGMRVYERSCVTSNNKPCL